ncbi:MAG: hypothetical protein HZA46_19890 [Planctomycetales bacterium]|nr:hypothetical protein [Planctomycetales bacterium]
MPDIPEYITVVCSTCHARFHPPSKHAGKTVICPDCGVMIPVPTIDEVLAEIEATRRSYPTPEEVGDYSVSAPAEIAKPSTRYFEVRAEIKREPLPPPTPRWFLIDGVFTYPWHCDAILRWIFLSCGFAAVGVIPTLAVVLTGSSGIGTWLVMVFMALPMIWLLVWTGSYAVSCCLRVLEDTAAGNQRVLEWPDPYWRDWAGQFFYIIYLACLASAPGYAIDRLLGGVPGFSGLATAASVWIVFPVCLLSSVTSISPWMPLSWPIVRSLVTCWWCWLAFYYESALLGAMWLGPLVFGLGLVCWPDESGQVLGATWLGPLVLFFGLRLAPVLTMLLHGPLLAAVCLIYARLLGRVAWHIGTKMPQPVETEPGEPE